MTLKFYLPVLTLAVIMAFVATQAVAQTGHNNKSGPAQATSQMTPENQAEVAKMRADFRQKITPLQDQLWAKQMEYDALASNPNTKPVDIKAIINSMSTLKSQIRTEREKFSNDMMAKGFHGKSGMGMGKGMGMGMGGHKGSKCKMMGRDTDGVPAGHRGQGSWHNSAWGPDYHGGGGGY